MGKLINYTGKKIGRMTILRRIEDHITKGGHPIAQYEYICDCSPNITRKITSASIRSGQKSCGCLGREAASKRLSERQKKYNKYDLETFPYGIGYTSNADSYGRNYFYFDKEDYDKIKEYCWSFHHDYLYARDIHSDKKNRHIYLHRLLFDMQEQYDYQNLIDHMGHDKFDCRRSMLRHATRAENNQNIPKQKNNTSGYPGVQWHKRNQAYEVYININQKRTYLGSFDNFNDAVKCRKAAEEKYYKNFSYKNSMKLKEEINSGSVREKSTCERESA